MSIGAQELRPSRGATHSKKRVGRGNGSGQGTYAGKGLKGQKQRSGKKLPYDAIKDFTGVTLTTIVPQVVVLV